MGGLSKKTKKQMLEKQESTRLCASCGNMLFYTKKDYIVCPFCKTPNKVTRYGRYGIKFEIANNEDIRKEENIS